MPDQLANPDRQNIPDALDTEAPQSSAHQEPAMLDVHPPHEAAHTWKDFFIHIITIIIGLLIAIGLEQTVEALHHRHERRNLIEKMQSEAVLDAQILHDDVTFASAMESWSREILSRLLQAKPVDGFVTIEIPPISPHTKPRQPSHSVWAVAKTNGTAALVPENLAALYNHLDYEADVELKAQEGRVIAEGKVHADMARFQITFTPRSTMRISVEQRGELIRDLAQAISAGNDNLFAAAAWAGVTDAVAHGVQDREAMDAYVERAFTSLPPS
jgi:hypothetical protein